MPNALKVRLRAGEVCLNGWSLFPSAAVAEIFAQAGWDSVTFDLQHGLHDYASLVACLQAIQPHPPTALVRVTSNDAGLIGRVLDAGAWGVICPLVNTAADARRLVDACLYPPAGQRSNGPVRAAFYGAPGMPYVATANAEVMILPQVETAEAVENLEEILDVEGVTGVYVGPSDLGLSMGLPGVLDREEPQVLEIYRRVVAAARARGLVAGIHTVSPRYGRRMAELGFNLVTVGSDSGLMAKASRAAVGEMREPSVEANARVLASP